MQVSNKTFLQTIFGEEWEKAHVTSFVDDPGNIAQERRGMCWAGGHAKDKLSWMKPGENQYYTISLFKEDGDRARRAKALFDATFVIVADDVGEKLPVEAVEKLPTPTFKLFSSEASEQWGWVLSEPCEDRHVVENLLDGLVAKGLAPDGKDPGMKGVTRYVRLPEGANTKANRWVGGVPFSCYIDEWNPELVYSIEELAEVFDIDLNAERNEAGAIAADAESPIVIGHPIWNYVNVTGYGEDGWVRVDCPNAAKHSTADASGGAFRIAEDGHLEYQCHHGACNGDHSTGKMTGPKIVKLISKQESIDLNRLIERHVEDVQIAGTKALVEAGIAKAVSQETYADYVEEDEPLVGWERDIIDYIYMAPRHEFYNLRSGVSIPAKGLDSLYLSECPGGKGQPAVASKQFLMSMDKNISSADGLGWLPNSLTAPKRDEVIINVEGKRLINTWRGLALTPIEGDVSIWLDHANYLFPNARERDVVIKYLAALVQRPWEKPAFAIVNRGTHRTGKDTFFEPVIKTFGAYSAGSANADQIVDGWGDYVEGKRVMIVNELDKAQNKRMSNALKTYVAPTATGVRTLNIKGKGVMTQADTLALIFMSNHRACMTIEQGDKRYFVVDSWVEPQDSDYYQTLRDWLEKDNGYAKVMNYLLNLDLEDFSLRTLPFLTDGALELVQSGKYDYEQDIDEMILAGEYPLNTPFTMKTLMHSLKERGHKCGRNGVIESLRQNGYFGHRGTAKVEGVTKNTPTFYTNELDEFASSKDCFEFYQAFHGGELIKK